MVEYRINQNFTTINIFVFVFVIFIVIPPVFAFPISKEKPINAMFNATNGTSPVNITLRVFYSGTDEMIYEFTNSSFNISFDSDVSDVNFDMRINTTDTIINFTKSKMFFNSPNEIYNMSKNITLVDDSQLNETIWVREKTFGKKIKTVAYQLYNFTYNVTDVNFTFNPSLVHDPNNLMVYKCRDWNFTNFTCNVTWVDVTEVGDYDISFKASINMIDDYAILKSTNSTNGTAFSLVEKIECNFLDGTGSDNLCHVPCGASLKSSELMPSKEKCYFNCYYTDINGDDKVDMRDIAIVAKAFSTKPGDLLWNPKADINYDGKIDMKDIGILAKKFAIKCF